MQIDPKPPQEALFDALVECAHCLVCVFDRDGRVVRFSAMCEEATGFAGQILTSSQPCQR